MNKGWKRYFLPTLILLFFLLVLSFLISHLDQIQKYLSRAEYKPLNLIINTERITGRLDQGFNNLAQGGETDKDGNIVSFSEISTEISLIKPKLIRIDHIFDLYTKVSFDNNQIVIDFTELDKALAVIKSSSAVPFLSLSYMPSALAINGDITGPPNNWNLWSELIKKTIEHVSGEKNLNLNEVYYEVWNEPDLFGNWRINGARNYLTLYEYTIIGANNAQNTNNFFIGGPAITHPMQNWILDFSDFIIKNNLRLDFFSYHLYNFSIDQINSSVTKSKEWIASTLLYDKPIIISEYGPSSENDPAYDNEIGAIFSITSVANLSNLVDKLFHFEIKDSPSEEKKQYWGRWGIFTNDKYGLTAKPRYYALRDLADFSGERLYTEGQGEFVSGISLTSDNSYKLILVNYQPERIIRQSEEAKFTFNNLPNGQYNLEKRTFNNSLTSIELIPVINHNLTKSVMINANTAIFYSLTKVGETGNFINGRKGDGDYALLFDNLTSELKYSSQKISSQAGTIEFWANFNLPFSSYQEEKFLSIRLNNQENLEAGKKQSLDNFSNEIAFGIYNKNKSLLKVKTSKTLWKSNEWHHLSFTWKAEKDNLKLKLFVDGNLIGEANRRGNLAVSDDFITIGPYYGAIDDLKISNNARDAADFSLNTTDWDENTILLRNFNKSTEE